MATPSASAKKNGIIFIFFTIMIDMVGIGIIIPVIPDLLKSLTGEELADTALLGGFLMFTYAIFQFLFAPVMGELSDRFGRKPILLVALFGLGVDYFIHAFSPTLTWLFIGRMIAGIFGSSHPVATAYVADISTKEEKAKNFGIIGAAFGLGFVIGPALGGLVGGLWGIRAPFILAGILSLLNFLYGAFILKESLPVEKRRAINYKKMIPFVSLVHIGKYRSVLGFVFAFGLANLAGQVMPSTWTFYTVERFGWNIEAIGISLMIVGALASATQGFLTGMLVKKYGKRNVIMSGFTLWALGMIAISLAGNTFWLYVGTIPYILGGIAGPTVQGVVSNRVSDREQGNLQGVLVSLVSLSSIIGPLVFTSVFKQYSDDQGVYNPGAPFFLGGVILVIAAVVAYLALRDLSVGEEDDEILDDQDIALKVE